MDRNKHSKYTELEERTYLFALDCRRLIDQLPKTIRNIEDGKQLVRSSGSVPANYIEANEAISSKDFIHRIKICRKEAKESCLWLRLLNIVSSDLELERQRLIAETIELGKIFGAILEKYKI